METDRDPLRKIPTKHAPETSADIGSILKSARQKKGNTLETVCQQTRISRRYLDALENNRFDEFPALAYLRGFLKSYCDYLEIDFESLWRLIVPEADAAVAAAAAAPDKTRANAAAPVAKAQPAPKPAKKPSAHPTDAAPPSAHASAAESPAGSSATGILVALAAAAGLGAWLILSRAPRQAQVPLPPPMVAPLRSDIQLLLELRDDAWISVVIDGQTRFEGRVPKSSRQEWKASKSVALRVSDPEALKLTLNGAPVKLPAPDASGLYRIEGP